MTFAPKTIPDNNPSGLTHTFSVTRSEPIGMVELDLANLSHQRPADLTVTLISPSGTRAVIRNPVPNPIGVSSNPWDLEDLVLDDFDGESPLGDWRVVAVDSASSFAGALNGWTMRFTERTDPIGFAYDSAGRLAAGFGPDGEQLYANSYDSQGRVIAQDDGVASNMVATFSYVERSDGGVRTIYRDRMGTAHVFEHDAQYNLSSYTNPIGATTLYGHNSFGDRIRLTNPLGKTTLFNYDNNGNLISTVDPGGFVTIFNHDQTNLSVVRDALGKESTFRYDQNNNLIEVRDALGNKDIKIYDTNTSKITGSILQDGAQINYRYAKTKVVYASHPVSGTATTDYDAIGRLTQLVDPDGFTTRFQYDSKSNVLSEIDAKGNPVRSVYDRRNRLVQKIDRNGNTTAHNYDNNGNLVRTTNSLGETVRYEYDGEDRQIRIIDGRGNARQIYYDSAGRITAEIDALGGSTTHQYDAAGNEIAESDSDGVVIQQTTYDDRDLPVTEKDAFGHTSISNYDAVGRRTQTTDPLQRNIRFTYDALDRLTEVRDPLNRASRQEYLSDDVVSRFIDPRNNAVRFSHDDANRIRTITTATGKVTSFTYRCRWRWRGWAVEVGEFNPQLAGGIVGVLVLHDQ